MVQKANETEGLNTNRAAMLNMSDAATTATRMDKQGDMMGALEAKTLEPWKVAFGQSTRELSFPDIGDTRLLSTEFGITPRPVMDARAEWEQLSQKDTVLFRFQSLNARFEEARACLAYETGADPNNVVCVANSETGISTVLKSMAWKAGDVLVLFGVESRATKNCALELQRRFGVVVKFEDSFLGEESVAMQRAAVDAVAEDVDFAKVRVIMMEHVTRVSNQRMMIQDLMEAFRKSRGYPRQPPAIAGRHV